MFCFSASVDCHRRDRYCDVVVGCDNLVVLELRDGNGDEEICCARGVCLNACEAARAERSSWRRNMIAEILELMKRDGKGGMARVSVCCWWMDGKWDREYNDRMSSFEISNFWGSVLLCPTALPTD